MDIKLILFSGYEILLSFIFGLGSIFIFLKVFDLLFLKTKKSKHEKNKLEEINIAKGILKGTIIVGMLLLIQGSIAPSVNTLRVMVMNMQEIKLEYILISFGYFFLFYLIGVILSILLILVTIKIYTLATIKVDEMQEIKNNNIAISIILSLVIIGMVFFMKPAMQHFLSSLINYDAIEKIISPDSSDIKIYSQGDERLPENHEAAVDEE